MAFKLVGDQCAGIRLVQKRRVNQLLANQIPEEEAFHMRDGRYACLVCRHKPVFDTVTMLSIHRNGKRHIQASHHKLRKKEIEFDKIHREKLKLLEKSTVEGKSLPPLLAQTKEVASGHAFLTSESNPALSKRTQDDDKNSSADDDGVLFFTRKRSGETLFSNENKKKQEKMEDILTRTKDSIEEKQPQYVFPWRFKEKRRENKPDKPVLYSEKQVGQTSVSKFKNLHSSGWIPNGDGTWHKDPDVEFDSDEEEPEPVQ